MHNNRRIKVSINTNKVADGAGRRGAYRAAKRKNNITMSEQPKRVTPNFDKRGKKQSGKIYEFENGVKIRDDAKGHIYPDNPSQNRGPHFNDPEKNHFDYWMKRRQDEKVERVL